MNNWMKNHSAGPQQSAGPHPALSQGYMQTLPGFAGRSLPQQRGGLAAPPAMSDEQLYNLVMSLKAGQPSAAMPAGGQLRQVPFPGGSGSPQSLEGAAATGMAKEGPTRIDQGDPETGMGTGSSEGDRNSDDAGKSKRVLANRQSAHRSRLRKLQYIQDLEQNVARIQAEIANLQPQLNALRSSYLDASTQNNKLRETVNELLNDARRKEARNSALRQEATDLLNKQGGGGQDTHALFTSHSTPMSRAFSAGHSLFGSSSNPITAVPQIL